MWTNKRTEHVRRWCSLPLFRVFDEVRFTVALTQIAYMCADSLRMAMAKKMDPN